MDQIEEIRSKLDLVAFISETVALKKAGRNFKGLCPFHIEKTPSFMVSPERQIWHCFGCGKGADVFGFLMEIERIEFGEALRILAKKVGVVLQSYRPSQSESEKDLLFNINHLAEEYFHYLLLNHPAGKKALNYILQRGITKNSLEQFKIGYAPNMWDGLQKFLVGKKGYKPEDLEKSGLIIPSSRGSQPTTLRLRSVQAHNSQQRYYDRFRDRLMFPLSDHRGNIVGFAGRVLDPNVKEAKYVNTPETLIYHKSELLYPLNITREDIKKENTAMVVEGELDAISSYQAGIKNVAAIKGSALTEEQSRLLKRFCENVILSLDADVAGDMAARRGIEIADKAGLNIKVLTLEKYKDPDEAAQKDPDYLKARYEKSDNIYDFFIDSAFHRFRGQTAEEKKKIGQEIIPTLAKIEDEIVKNIFVKKLAQRLGVNEESVILQIEKFNKKLPLTPQTQTADKPIVKSRRPILEEYFLALAFQSKKSDMLLEEENRSLFAEPLAQKVITCLVEYLKTALQFSSQFFFQFLPAELQPYFDKLYLIDFGEQIEDEEWSGKEIQKTKTQLQILAIKEELQQTLTLVRQEQNQGEDSSPIKAKILDLTKKLGELERRTAAL